MKVLPAGDSPLEILRLEILSSNVLLCPFEGDVQTLEFYLEPETMHFGVDTPTGSPASFHKTLRNPETENDEGQPIAEPWKGAQQGGVIDINRLATTMGSQLSAPSFKSAPFFLADDFGGTESPIHHPRLVRSLAATTGALAPPVGQLEGALKHLSDLCKIDVWLNEKSCVDDALRVLAKEMGWRQILLSTISW